MFSLWYSPIEKTLIFEKGNSSTLGEKAGLFFVVCLPFAFFVFIIILLLSCTHTMPNHIVYQSPLTNDSKLVQKKRVQGFLTGRKRTLEASAFLTPFFCCLTIPLLTMSEITDAQMTLTVQSESITPSPTALNVQTRQMIQHTLASILLIDKSCHALGLFPDLILNYRGAFVEPLTRTTKV